MTRDDVAMVTDSSASLPGDVLARERIIIVPIGCVIDGEVHKDGTMPAEEFYSMLDQAKSPPTTLSPEPREFVEAFGRAHAGGAAHVLCLTMSAELSATYKAAQSAVEIARDALPGLTITLVDTGGLAMTHGFAVLAAADALRAGTTVDEAAAAAKNVGREARLVGVLDSMRYLARGGRVPWIVHWAASLLQIKPVLAWSGGSVKAIARPRTMARALDRIVEYASGRADGHHLRVAVMHAAAPEMAQALRQRVCERLPASDVMMSEFTSAMGVHTGPGFAGLAFYAND